MEALFNRLLLPATYIHILQNTQINVCNFVWRRKLLWLRNVSAFGINCQKCVSYITLLFMSENCAVLAKLHYGAAIFYSWLNTVMRYSSCMCSRPTTTPVCNLKCVKSNFLHLADNWQKLQSQITKKKCIQSCILSTKPSLCSCLLGKDFHHRMEANLSVGSYFPLPALCFFPWGSPVIVASFWHSFDPLLPVWLLLTASSAAHGSVKYHGTAAVKPQHSPPPPPPPSPPPNSIVPFPPHPARGGGVEKKI